MPSPPFRPVIPFAFVPRPVGIPIAPPTPAAVTSVSTPLVPVVVPAVPMPAAPDASRRARFEYLIAELQRQRAQMSRAIYQCGKILEELSSPELLAFAGATRVDDVLERYGLPTGPTVTKYITIAQHMNEDQAAQLGVERAYAIIRAAKLLPKPEQPATLLARNPMIPVGPAAMQLTIAPLRSVLGWVEMLAAPPEPPRGVAKQAESLRDKLQRRFVTAGIGKAKTQVRARGADYVVKIELSLEQAAALLSAVKS